MKEVGNVTFILCIYMLNSKSSVSVRKKRRMDTEGQVMGQPLPRKHPTGLSEASVRTDKVV